MLYSAKILGMPLKRLNIKYIIMAWQYSSFSERILLVLEIGKDFAIAIRWIDSHLKTGFVPTMTERFQFVIISGKK